MKNICSYYIRSILVLISTVYNYFAIIIIIIILY